MSLDAEKNNYYWKLLQFEVQEKKIARVFEIFRLNNIEPVLIKGWAAARLYPRPFERLSVDVDLAVDPLVFAEGKKLLIEKNVSGVDLHEGLRHLDILAWKDLFARSQLVKIKEAEIRILSEEDHLRVLCVHWLNDGGTNKERLWDIFYAIENRSKEFDWERCLECVGAKRKQWIICAAAMAEKYLLLDLSKTPLAGKSGQIPKWLIKAVEKEWKRDIKLIPLENCLKDKKIFFQQLKLRLPPNPVESTIEMEGAFDEKTRIFYQLRALLMRLKVSVKKINWKFIRN